MYQFPCEQVLLSLASLVLINGHISLPTLRSLPPLLHPRPNRSPYQQPSRCKDENKHDQLIFRTVPLKASSKDIFLRSPLADWQMVVQTELLITVVAASASCSGSFVVGRGFAGVGAGAGVV